MAPFFERKNVTRGKKKHFFSEKKLGNWTQPAEISSKTPSFSLVNEYFFEKWHFCEKCQFLSRLSRANISKIFFLSFGVSNFQSRIKVRLPRYLRKTHSWLSSQIIFLELQFVVQEESDGKQTRKNWRRKNRKNIA